MHEGAAITTTTASKFSNSTIVNAATLHQSTHDGTITVLHPHQQHVEMDDFIASTTSNPCSTISSQIVPSQTKIIVSSNEFQALKDDDVSSVLINGTLSNINDPNVLILPATETCDKDTLSLSQLTSSSQIDQVEIDLQDINSVNDETSSGEGELSVLLTPPRTEFVR